jgi:rubrerythrin
MATTTITPRWIQELERYLPIKRQFYLYGNIYDLLLYPPKPDEPAASWQYLNIRAFLRRFFIEHGYQLVGFYDVVDGMCFDGEQDAQVFKKLAAVQAETQKDGRTRLGALRDPNAALESIRTVVANTTTPSAFVLDFASRLIASPEQLHDSERALLIKLFKCSQEARTVRSLRNLTVLICDKLNDLPAWLYVNNPLAQSIQVDKPSDDERRRFAETMLANNAFHDAEKLTDEQERRRVVQLFVDLTKDMRTIELEGLQTLSVRSQIPLTATTELVDKFKFGVKKSAWEEVTWQKLQPAYDELAKRVKGQRPAINAVLDIVKRARLGLSGIEHSAQSNKPRGILFFAGPTGVGKTEMAKALAQLLFGHESKCTRFDMSEYGHRESDQKLFGAPPGYVGYEEGGQLTNRMKEDPFRVLLFDEIEKADGSILDKFLQVLEDGRLTDGKGETVYFSESIIIFTSNLGAVVETRDAFGHPIRKPNIWPYAWKCKQCSHISLAEEQPHTCDSCRGNDFEKIETPYSLVRERILAAIKNHFELSLGRPELYNRFGSNFVVFDFVRPAVMREIIEKIFSNIRSEVQNKHDIEVDLDLVKDEVFQRVKDNVAQGGRGVGNFVASAIVNPLSRYIFEHLSEYRNGGRLKVKAIRELAEDGATYYSLDIEKIA